MTEIVGAVEMVRCQISGSPPWYPNQEFCSCGPCREWRAKSEPIDEAALDKVARKAAGFLGMLKPGPGNASGLVIDFSRLKDDTGKVIRLEEWLKLHWRKNPSTFPWSEYHEAKKTGSA